MRVGRHGAQRVLQGTVSIIRAHACVVWPVLILLLILAPYQTALAQHATGAPTLAAVGASCPSRRLDRNQPLQSHRVFADGKAPQAEHPQVGEATPVQSSACPETQHHGMIVLGVAPEQVALFLQHLGAGHSTIPTSFQATPPRRPPITSAP